MNCDTDYDKMIEPYRTLAWILGCLRASIAGEPIRDLDEAVVHAEKILADSSIISDRGSLAFSQRHELGKRCEDWMRENGVLNCPESVIAWLAYKNMVDVSAGRDLADADRRAGAAERQLEDARDTIYRSRSWRDGWKRRLGYGENVSFDVVFDDLLAKARPDVAPIIARAKKNETARPTVVCICGSTRFYDAWQKAIYDETMKGNITLQVGFYHHADPLSHGQEVGCSPEQKIMLDELHKRKIDLADEIFVLNVNGYIGDSTRSEIRYARDHGKLIRFLEPVDVEDIRC